MLHSLVPFPSSSLVTVGNGSTLPISHTDNTTISASACQFFLNNVLLVPSLVKNLLSIRRFTTDNVCSIEFDPLGFSVKVLRTKAVIIRCNSRGDLYTIPATTATQVTHGLLATSTELWHHRLGHSGHDAM
jgi:hypothetical protein